MKEYNNAIADCEEALRINDKFGKAHKRLFKCYLCLGEFEVIVCRLNFLKRATKELKLAQELDPSDLTNVNDSKTLENVVMQERVVTRHVEKEDYETALTYLD